MYIDIFSDAIKKKQFLYKKKIGLQKIKNKHSKSVFLYTHLKEITS